ncbi:MAG: hypothetical protein KGI70_02075 [Patescibacteria group bacterium]|nr:hypothetical protein [Patescibacteria group bacterium]
MNLKLLIGTAAGTALLMGSGVALAQTQPVYSASGGAIIPQAGNTNTAGVTEPAGSTSGTVSGTSTVTPGVPNTGAGGDFATTITLMTGSLVLLGAGGTYLVRTQA